MSTPFRATAKAGNRVKVYDEFYYKKSVNTGALNGRARESWNAVAKFVPRQFNGDLMRN